MNDTIRRVRRTEQKQDGRRGIKTGDSLRLRFESTDLHRRIKMKMGKAARTEISVRGSANTLQEKQDAVEWNLAGAARSPDCLDYRFMLL